MFKYTYKNLPSFLYSDTNLNKVKNPELIIFNDKLANELELDSSFFKSIDGIKVLSGSESLLNETVISQAYCGHQFGYLNKLGDGRALLLGEITTLNNKIFDIHLKGSGRTKYSRGGDGRATLSSMLREYIMSEAMFALGVPTTRSLSVISTGEKVFRDAVNDGAVLARIASSHIRVGTFEYAYVYGKDEDIRKLADYAINRHYPHLNNEHSKYSLFLKEVCKRQAQTIAKWQSIGFIHGVMNTDNVLISGETIDYGPCAFMNTYNPETVYSSIDKNGRYAFKNQPFIGAWNLARFSETLLSLLDVNREKSMSIAKDSIEYYYECYKEEWLSLMTKKIGIFSYVADDEVLVLELLRIMNDNKLDYTNTFRQLTLEPMSLLSVDGFEQWHSKWKSRKEIENKTDIDNQSLMKKYNCNVIPRNNQIEKVLKEAVDNGDYSSFNELLNVLRRPFDYDADVNEYVNSEDDINYRTYCNT